MEFLKHYVDFINKRSEVEQQLVAEIVKRGGFIDTRNIDKTKHDIIIIALDADTDTYSQTKLTGLMAENGILYFNVALTNDMSRQDIDLDDNWFAFDELVGYSASSDFGGYAAWEDTIYAICGFIDEYLQ